MGGAGNTYRQNKMLIVLGALGHEASDAATFGWLDGPVPEKRPPSVASLAGGHGLARFSRLGDVLCCCALAILYTGITWHSSRQAGPGRKSSVWMIAEPAVASHSER